MPFRRYLKTTVFLSLYAGTDLILSDDAPASKQMNDYGNYR